MQRGYGVSALINPDFVAPLARAADDAGYQTFWVNDVADGNGLEQLARAQAVTTRIRLGVGVLPVDRWDANSITAELERLNLDPARLVLGLGAGRLYRGSLETTRKVAAQLAKRMPVRILVGALGPRMCRLAGSGADGVLLNWVTADAAQKLSAITRPALATQVARIRKSSPTSALLPMPGRKTDSGTRQRPTRAMPPMPAISAAWAFLR